MILFDLDGTLTDSGEGIINCAKFALEHFGLPIPGDEEMRCIVGPPLQDSFRKFGVPPERIDEAIATFRSRYLPIGKYENHPYPGIDTLLRSLQSKGEQLFVATSKPEQTAREVLEHFSLAQYFECICGASFDYSRSTKEEVIAYLLAQYPDNGKVIMVGDTEFDVIGAAAHGIPTIGVSWGYGNAESLRSAGAIAIADDPVMLEELLKKHNFI